MNHKRQRIPPLRTTTPEAMRRIAVGLAIPELARRVGVSRQTIWRWETGLVVPPLLSKRAWHNALAKAEGIAHRRLA